jgi:predicted DsbA family dithiol-disulfide isomerase
MRDRIMQKNGEEMTRGIITRLERTGRASGINFSFGGKIGSTRDSHRLIRYAGQKDKRVQQSLVERILHEIFEQDLDVTSRSELAAIAVACGLLDGDVTKILEDELHGAEVDQMAAYAREIGIRHVPFMEVNGKTFEGSQDVSELYEILVDAKTRS